jgi:Ni/Co efflux regulator RcnB
MSKGQLKVPAPAALPPTLARLKAIKGPYKGFAYKLVAGKVSIGRSSENDISLVDDDKCSRKQAIINLNPDNSYSIKDVSNRASIKINDISKIQSKLQDGDLIQFGSTVLQFERKETAPHHPSQGHNASAPVPLYAAPTPAAASAPVPVPINQEVSSTDKTHQPLVPVQESAENLPGLKEGGAVPNLAPSSTPNYPNYDLNPYAPHPHLNRKRKKKKKSFMTKIIFILIALGGVYLFLSDTQDTKEKKDKLRSNLDREEDIKTLSELRQEEKEKRDKNAHPSYKNAQSAYTKGIRDYRKGVYNRAIESFRVCKTLYPQHDLCASYLKKAEIKNQQIIQAWMVAGKDYREKRRFAPCMSSFKNVMMAIRDKQNLTYKEAFENYKICQIQHEDRY